MESKLNFYQLFSQFIFSEPQDESSFNDLSGEAPILRPLLPSMIKNLCQFMLDPHFSIEQAKGPYFFKHFDSLVSAKNFIPELEVKTMLPYEVFKFINSSENKIIFDCKELGATIAAKDAFPLEQLTGPLSLTLEPFFCYAFSDDLWNTQGKWTRFHARLITLLDNKSLLVNSLGPGHYELGYQAQKLENFGIKGMIKDNSYQLILPWSYPLKALNELEKIISQEF
ncbi:MAG TPA: hypothetical protein VKY27_05155 [Bacteriovoracaceae bacterium]|nr:hypothetical protein [Bacteriovoracaceae bacterium]